MPAASAMDTFRRSHSAKRMVSIVSTATGAAEHNNQLVDGITRATVKRSEAEAKEAKYKAK